MQEPIVSILIPVYNGAKTISVSIESCLCQSYKNIEILVLDDVSTDDTVLEIKKFSNVKLLQHERRLGTPGARNSLLKYAKGEFVAWLDADDTMMPNRIERQVLFMQNNPEVDIAGSWIYTDNRFIAERKLPTSNAMITAHLWFKNCMVQPAIISRNFYAGENIFYNTEYFYMQDYELWYRLRNKKTFANIPEFLTCYHFLSADETRQKHSAYNSLQKPDKLWIVKWADSNFGLDGIQRELLQDFLSGSHTLNPNDVKALKSIFNKIYNDRVFNQVRENKLMIHLYRLLVFKRLGLKDRLRNIDLLLSLRHYNTLKKEYLIQ